MDRRGFFGRLAAGMGLAVVFGPCDSSPTRVEEAEVVGDEFAGLEIEPFVYNGPVEFDEHWRRHAASMASRPGQGRVDLIGTFRVRGDLLEKLGKG